VSHALASRCEDSQFSTTDGLISLINLDAQIEGQEAEARSGSACVEGQVALIELITFRGLILGRVSDFERAAEHAEQLLRNEPGNGAVFTARARTRANFHRFADALDDLRTAERLLPRPDALNGERAAILQALGRYDEAFAIRQEAATLRSSFETLGALAGLCAERGEIETAEQMFLESQSCYRGVSPFPLAILNFQRGLMWKNKGRLEDARLSFDVARRYVPRYAAALGHLAEVEAELGDTETAISRLLPLAKYSEDPDYAAQLARILGEVGRLEEARIWSDRAGTVYDELVASHPEAFADHAAEFWLDAGGDPKKALPLARLNFANRPTPRAYALLSRAAEANGTVTG
jgi:tetratricopeptide (TPR) repeat protein